MVPMPWKLRVPRVWYVIHIFNKKNSLAMLIFHVLNPRPIKTVTFLLFIYRQHEIATAQRRWKMLVINFGIARFIHQCPPTSFNICIMLIYLKNHVLFLRSDHHIFFKHDNTHFLKFGRLALAMWVRSIKIDLYMFHFLKAIDTITPKTGRRVFAKHVLWKKQIRCVSVRQWVVGLCLRCAGRSMSATTGKRWAAFGAGLAIGPWIW